MFTSRKKPTDSTEGDAKMKVLEDLRSSMSDMMANKMKDGMQKVSVMAPDKEGLAKGLQKAEEVVDPNESEESPSEEHGPLGMDEIDEAMSILQQLKDEMSGKQSDSKLPPKDDSEEEF